MKKKTVMIRIYVPTGGRSKPEPCVITVVESAEAATTETAE